MANLINASTIEYTPLNNPDYFLKSLRQGVTLKNDYVRVIPGVTKEARIKKMVLNDPILQESNRDCAWTPIQRIDITDKLMSVKDWKVNFSQCLSDLDNLYSEQLWSSGAKKTELPEGVEAAMMEEINTQMGMDIEKKIWDGFTTELLASPNSIKVAGVNINASNVLTELAKIYENCPTVVLSEGWFNPEKAAARIFVDIDTYRYLQIALGTTPTAYVVTAPNWTVGADGKIAYMGVEVVAVTGLQPNTAVMGSRDNMIVLTDAVTDLTYIQAQLLPFPNDDTYAIKAELRLGTGIIFDDEMVIYSI